MNYEMDKVQRKDHFVRNHTQKNVGPGYYKIERSIDRTIKNPTIPRAGWGGTGLKVVRKRNRGSIRDNYEEESNSSDDGKVPGPGDYLTLDQTSTFGRQAYIHDYPQNFGSVVGRFKTQPSASNELGPGQYLSQNLLPKFQLKKQNEQSPIFRSPQRSNTMVNAAILENPS